MLPRLAYRLVVQVDADYGICTHSACFFFQFLQSPVFGLSEDFLVRSGPTAHDVADAGEKVAEYVGSDDGLAGDDAQVVLDLPAFDVRCGCEDHV